MPPSTQVVKKKPGLAGEEIEQAEYDQPSAYPRGLRSTKADIGLVYDKRNAGDVDHISPAKFPTKAPIGRYEI